jgi:effector-binding domain-containing protein
MFTEPVVVERKSQPYAAVKATLTMDEISVVLPDLVPEVFDWLEGRGIARAGEPFVKYNSVEMDRKLEVEVGLPVASGRIGDNRVLGGVLPGGRYASLRHTGHPKGLSDATAALLGWAETQGLDWDVTRADGAERWGARLEIYQSDPPEDIDGWETELAFRLAD